MPKWFGKGCTEWPRTVKPSLKLASLCGAGVIRYICDRQTYKQTDWQTSLTSVTIVCISFIRCSLKSHKLKRTSIIANRRVFQKTWCGDSWLPHMTYTPTSASYIRKSHSAEQHVVCPLTVNHCTWMMAVSARWYRVNEYILCHKVSRLMPKWLTTTFKQQQWALHSQPFHGLTSSVNWTQQWNFSNHLPSIPQRQIRLLTQYYCSTCSTTY